MRISDWSSDVCSSDLAEAEARRSGRTANRLRADANGLAIGLDNGAAADADADHIAERKRDGDALDLAACIGTHRAVLDDADVGGGATHAIGRASCRERVCQYV